MENLDEFFVVYSEFYFELRPLYDEEEPSREVLQKRFPEISTASVSHIYSPSCSSHF